MPALSTIRTPGAPAGARGSPAAPVTADDGKAGGGSGVQVLVAAGSPTAPTASPTLGNRLYTEEESSRPHSPWESPEVRTLSFLKRASRRMRRRWVTSPGLATAGDGAATSPLLNDCPPRRLRPAGPDPRRPAFRPLQLLNRLVCSIYGLGQARESYYRDSVVVPEPEEDEEAAHGPWLRRAIAGLPTLRRRLLPDSWQRVSRGASGWGWNGVGAARLLLGWGLTASSSRQPSTAAALMPLRTVPIPRAGHWRAHRPPPVAPLYPVDHPLRRVCARYRHRHFGWGLWRTPAGRTRPRVSH